MNKENNILKKLDKKSLEEFELYIKYFNQNNKDKYLFYKFLFSDIISESKIENKDINIEDVIYNPSIIIREYLNLILEKSENQNNLYKEIKDKLKSKVENFKKKIEECKTNINILRKIYLEISIEKILPKEAELELSFKNKSVLKYSSFENSLKLGEIFARYIFTSISNNSVEESSQKSFYSDEKINSYYYFEGQYGGDPSESDSENDSENDSEDDDDLDNSELIFREEKLKTSDKIKKNNNEDKKNNNEDEKNNNEHEKNNNEHEKNNIKKIVFKNFSNINNNFKYWIFLIKIIGEIFSVNSNFDIIFNEKKFNNEIDNLIKIKKEEKKDKKTDKKKEKEKKSQRGGGSNKNLELKAGRIQNLFEGTRKDETKNSNKKTSENKNSALKKYYLDIFSKCFINPIDDKEQINLRKIYINPFELRIKDYFEQCIKNKNKNNSDVSPDFKIQNPFFKIDMVPIKTYLSLGEIKPDRKIFPQNLRNLKFDIFQSLYLFKNPDNQKEIEEFITKLKLKLIFLLYYLYKIKKNIYEKFMIELGEKFINNTNLQKTGFGKNLKNEKNHLKVLKNLNVNNFNNNFNFNFKDEKNRNKKKLDYYIKILKKEILKLKDKKGEKDYDKLILLYENEIKKSIIQRYELE